MSLKRKLIMFATAATIAPLARGRAAGGDRERARLHLDPAEPAGAVCPHTVSCGDIKWEPQSVEGPKGLRNCHGSVGRFAELSDDSKPWRATRSAAR